MTSLTTNQHQETWRPVVGFPAYEVSDMGRVRITKTGRMLRQRVQGDGRRMSVSIGPKGNRYERKVHRLVGDAFIGLLPAHLETCHNDGNGCNNALLNLRYDTRKANEADKRLHGTANIGERNGRAKLIPTQVAQIRAATAGINELSARFGVSKTAIRDVLNRETWRHV